MCYYISTIKVNKLFHLQDLEIPISEKNPIGKDYSHKGYCRLFRISADR